MSQINCNSIIIKLVENSYDFLELLSLITSLNDFEDPIKWALYFERFSKNIEILLYVEQSAQIYMYYKNVSVYYSDTWIFSLRGNRGDQIINISTNQLQELIKLVATINVEEMRNFL